MTTYAIVIPIHDVFGERGKVYDHERPSSLSVRVEAETPSVAVDMLGRALRRLVAEEAARAEKERRPRPRCEDVDPRISPCPGCGARYVGGVRSHAERPGDHDRRVAVPLAAPDGTLTAPEDAERRWAQTAATPEPSEVDRAIVHLRQTIEDHGDTSLVLFGQNALDVVLAEVERLRVETEAGSKEIERLEGEADEASAELERVRALWGGASRALGELLTYQHPSELLAEIERLTEDRERQDQAIRAARDELARAIADRDDAREGKAAFVAAADVALLTVQRMRPVVEAAEQLRTWMLNKTFAGAPPNALEAVRIAVDAYHARAKREEPATTPTDLQPGDEWEDPSDGEVLRVDRLDNGRLCVIVEPSRLMAYNRHGDITSRMPNPATWRLLRRAARSDAQAQKPRLPGCPGVDTGSALACCGRPVAMGEEPR